MLREERDKSEKNLEKGNQKINEELIEQIKQIKTGKKNAKEISTLSPKTKWRYLKDIKPGAQKPLWYLRA